MRTPSLARPLLLAALAASWLGVAPKAEAGATIVINNINAPGEGFNDPAPATEPAPGNPGTTIGEQRLAAFQYAADLWGAQLDSSVTIVIQARFTPLSCNATGAVLGSAGTIQIFANFPGAPEANTWYHSALANKLAQADLSPGPAGGINDDLVANFNANLGQPNCLASSGWYYGLDANQPANRINLVTVLLHEFAHGLGFSSFASRSTGAYPLNLPGTYDLNILSTLTGQSWADPAQTNAQRLASMTHSRRLVWTGEAVNDHLPDVLSSGTPLMSVNSPGGIAGAYAVGAAAFGPPLSAPGVSGSLVQGLDADEDGAATAFTATDACSPLANAAAVAGNIALVDRGACAFTIKVKNAQDAGAIAVVVADNAAGSPPAGLGGADPTIVIPSVRITLADGNTIKANLAGGVSVTLGVDVNVYAGADPQGRALLNAPDPIVSGSSISHWDPIAFRNQLMEPSINADLTHGVKPPEDLTLPLMRDIGWFPDADLDGVADDQDDCPGSDLRLTVVVGSCDSGVPNPLDGATGCTRADDVLGCAAGASNHGAFVSCVAHLTNGLKAAGAISGKQKGAIQSCAAGSSLP